MQIRLRDDTTTETALYDLPLKNASIPPASIQVAAACPNRASSLRGAASRRAADHGSAGRVEQRVKPATALELRGLAVVLSLVTCCEKRALKGCHHSCLKGTVMKPLALGITALALAGALSWGGVARPQSGQKTYPAMAPVSQYRIASRADEISLARSAAPPSISADASVLVLGARGYESAATGTNGWVCFVERSWAAGFDDRQFWNSRLRGPNCFNPIAVRTELPRVLKRTEWVLAGVSKARMMDRTKAAIADGTFKAPEPGALTYMMSKNGYVSDDADGPWLPHMMFFVPRGQAANWGADKDGSPVIGAGGTELDTMVLLVPVRRWSDGTPGPQPRVVHKM